MRCDECKEQVFELIEQEAIDPATVRALLDRCPECQVLFDETKAALRAAAMLPLEEPPPSIDAAILRAAAAREPMQLPSRPWRLQAPPWAMAAVALLAVGIGVWAIPREGALNESDAAAGNGEASAELGAEAVLADAPSREPAIVAVEPEPVRAPEAAEVDRPAPDLQEAGSSPARTKQRSAAPAPPAAALRMAEARKTSPEVTAVAGASAELEDRGSSDTEVGASRLPGEAHKEVPISECRRRVADHESGDRDEADAAIDAEDALALGKCYQQLGEKKKARRWLKRAAGESVTKARAEQALRALDVE